jgi:hypothetical protein
MGGGGGDRVQERDAELGKIEWRCKRAIQGVACSAIYEAYVAGRMRGWIEQRPLYCDRGHFKAMVDVPNLDGQDAFPRYFMRFETAVQEMEEFIRWRLWGVRARTSEGGLDVFMAETLRIKIEEPS